LINTYIGSLSKWFLGGVEIVFGKIFSVIINEPMNEPVEEVLVRMVFYLSLAKIYIDDRGDHYEAAKVGVLSVDGV
jgi:hypothetical protein